MSKINTTEEFLVSKWADSVVGLCFYYKYVFTFSGTDDEGNKIDCSVGGGSDEIYRLEVVVGSKYKIGDLQPFSATVKDKEGKEIVDFYDY